MTLHRRTNGMDGSMFHRGFRLRKLVVKPTLRCTADCKGCTSRRSLHRSVHREPILTLQQWLQVILDARTLGCRQLSISGGEPTLYPQLIDLVSYASHSGMRVSMNTNGSRVTREFAERLIAAGLWRVKVSLYSHLPQVQSQIRRSNKLWDNACSTIRMYAELKETHPDFQVSTQTILLRENFDSFDELLRFHHSLGSERVRVSYLEGDFERKKLLSAADVRRFRTNLIPRLRKFCHS